MDKTVLICIILVTMSWKNYNSDDNELKIMKVIIVEMHVNMNDIKILHERCQQYWNINCQVAKKI